MSHLLDVNALIALAWPTHEHHNKMIGWFRQYARRGWATNALTQGAFVRIVSQQAFAGRSIAMADVSELLLRNTAHARHHYLRLDFDFAEVLGTCTGGILGHRQITDAWLLTSAIRSKMKLVTFDGGLGQLLRSAAERERHILLLGK
jgi:toxin-antitoxin system PIN domain toxin